MDSEAGARSGRWVAARAVTVLGCVLVAFAVLAPTEPDELSVWSFARVPLEPLVAAALVLLVPERARRPIAACLGTALGVIALVKALDLGFFATLGRPFHVAHDWRSFGSVVDLLSAEVGRVGAVIVVVVVAAVVLALVIACAVAAVRLCLAAVEHRAGATRAIAAFGLVWAVCAVVGVHVIPGQPVAASSAAAFVYDRARQASADLQDQRRFASGMATDAYRDVPGDRLLTALRGKDVALVFVESYGRTAVEDPEIGPRVTAVLDEGTRRLGERGFRARSAFLTSPTVGGTSWLAHATLQSGLWVDNQLRYDTVTAGDRLTISSAFNRAGWRTVSVAPANTGDWPERPFYGFDGYYDARAIGYRGPLFALDSIPDQYSLGVFHRRELAAADRSPVMAEIDLISSHWPWDRVPRLVPWAELGDGSILAGRPSSVSPPGDARAGYADTVQYTLRTLISFVQHHGDDDLVLIVVGDHQPASMVTGGGPERDVPVTVVARDPAVLARIDAWGWDSGLRPGPQAPVWRMDAFRDRFLSAFGAPPP